MKLLSILGKEKEKLGHVKNVVVMEDLAGKPVEVRKAPEGVKCIRFKEVIAKGDVDRAVTRLGCPPGPDDVGIIMYTSGSTGKPKAELQRIVNMDWIPNIFLFENLTNTKYE